MGQHYPPSDALADQSMMDLPGEQTKGQQSMLS